jgi:hypothetical protein
MIETSTRCKAKKKKAEMLERGVCLKDSSAQLMKPPKLPVRHGQFGKATRTQKMTRKKTLEQ